MDGNWNEGLKALTKIAALIVGVVLLVVALLLVGGGVLFGKAC